MMKPVTSQFVAFADLKIQGKSWLTFGSAGFRFDLVADLFRVRVRF